MKSLRLCFCFVFVFILIFSSCSDSTSPVVENSNDLIPLKVGNHWNYTFTEYDSNSVVASVESRERIIVGDTLINNIKWYTYSTINKSHWYANKSDGYWTYIDADYHPAENDFYEILYKYPSRIGDIYGSSDIQNEVLGINKNITIAAGTFNVLHIKTKYGSSFGSYFFESSEVFIAPKIGIVKSTIISEKSNGETFIQYKSELESYSLK